MDANLQTSDEASPKPEVPPNGEMSCGDNAAARANPNRPAPSWSLPEPEDAGCWNQVDPRMRILWRLEATIAPLILLLVSLGLLALGQFKGFHVLRNIASATSLALLAIVVAYPPWWARRLFEATRYRLAAETFERRRGVFWQESLAVPLNRLQHVDLEQGPLDRYIGLATLRLYTAGSQRAVHAIDGLSIDQARALRALLLGKQHHDGPS